MVLINTVSQPASQQVPRRTIIQDPLRKLSLNIKLTTNDVITPSWATQLVIVLINTVSQPALQQVPGRTHHTGLTTQAVCQNYVKQLTTSSRRHIWRHMARRHTKHSRRDFSRHLKQQLDGAHWVWNIIVWHIQYTAAWRMRCANISTLSA